MKQKNDKIPNGKHGETTSMGSKCEQPITKENQK